MHNPTISLRQILLIAAGTLLTVVGLIGLLLPVLPGILFLAAAAGCFATASNRFRRRLENNARFGPYAKRWAAANQLPLAKRIQVGAWLMWATLADTLRR